MSPLSWQRSIEQIVLSGTGRSDRVIGLTSVHSGAGVSLICRHIARTIASSGRSALLIDMSKPQPISNPAIREDIATTPYGCDVLAGLAEDGSRALFDDLPRLREMLTTDFAGYDRIVIDMAPIFDNTDTGFNSVAAAAVCDRLFLVCAVGTDSRAEIASAVSLLKGAGVPLSGLISNEYMRVDVRKQLAGLVMPWARKQAQRWAQR